MDDKMTARRHSQHLGEGSADAGKRASVAAKAAAIDAAQARPLTWKNVVKRAAVVAVGGAAIYLVLPRLMAVLGSWPRLSTLNPIWFTVAIAAEVISFICNFALQRLALRTRAWFAVGFPSSPGRRPTCSSGTDTDSQSPGAPRQAWTASRWARRLPRSVTPWPDDAGLPAA
jgi:hypothetical protein